MKALSLVIACATLPAATQAQAIDAEYRRLLERSGCTQVTEVLSSEAGIGITIEVPGATAPWSCLSDAKGHVQGAMFTGRDGD